MKAIIQQEKRRSTRRWVFFFGGVIAVLYLCVLVSTYVLKPGHDASDPLTVNKYEQQVIHVDAYVASATPAYKAQNNVVLRRDYQPAGTIHREVVETKPIVHAVTNAPATSQPIRVYTTSSAKVHNVGSGRVGGSSSTAITNVSSSVPFTSSTSNMVMSTAVWTSSRSLSAQNTLAAEQRLLAANNADAVADDAGGPHRVGGKPLDPFMDPIGDGLIALLLAALAYAGVIVHKRKRA